MSTPEADETDVIGRLDSEPLLESGVSLGEIDPARSRHMWRRSGVLVQESLVVVGTWDGQVLAFDVADETHELTLRFRQSFDDRPVTLASVGEHLAVGGRGSSGTISLLDASDGSERWRVDGAAIVGNSQKDSVFYWPYVVALEVGSDGDSLYAAIRRYERDAQDRRWHSAILAFDADGEIRWRYEVDASPISLALDHGGERLAVGYNRCFGEHDDGLVVLDTASGDVDWCWDPDVDGDRRVGAVDFDPTGSRLAVASHGDFSGYCFDADGNELWSCELAREREIAGQTLYAYPISAVATSAGVTFLTGNTYARESRETNACHPDEHTVFSFDSAGQRQFTLDTGGFVHEVAIDGSTLLVPTAQNFRVRDATTHGLGVVDLETGSLERHQGAGICTSADTDGELIAVIEEPIEYHDEEVTRGTYALHVGSLE